MSSSIYPHNDLLNTSYHLLERIERQSNGGNENGITLDCIGCITVLAATSEALLNAIGQKRIENWQERQSPRSKIIQICGAANLEFNEEAAPYNTIKALRNVRNQIMHCQPEITDNLEQPANHIEVLNASWMEYATPEFCREAFDSIKMFQHAAFDGLNITPGELQSFAIWDFVPD